MKAKKNIVWNEKEGYCKAIKNSAGKSGIYFIFSPIGALVYIGYSGYNLYKTITRHFQSWDDPKQYRAEYSKNRGYLISIIYCTPARAAKIEPLLIAKYKPRDGKLKLSFYSNEEQKKAWERLKMDELPLPF